ncbi:hypothetical protein BDW72DRAFT_25763 [Aspergillus terricola var. indicus]
MIALDLVLVSALRPCGWGTSWLSFAKRRCFGCMLSCAQLSSVRYSVQPGLVQSGAISSQVRINHLWPSADDSLSVCFARS